MASGEARTARKTRRARSKRLLTLAGGLVLAAGVALALWLRPQPDPDPTPRPLGPRVDVATPRPLSGPAFVRQTGFLRAAESTEVSSEIAARIATVSDRFVPGERVAKGHELVGLESTALAADLARDRAQLERAIAARDRSVAALERERKLVERNFRSAASLDSVRTEAETAKADVAAARASVEAARIRFDGMTVDAPFDALVVEENASRGQFVQPGTPLGRLVLASHAELAVSVRPEVFSRIGAYRALQASVPILDPEDDRELAVGTITAISPSLDPRTRTRELRIRIREPFSREPPLTIHALVAARLPIADASGSIYELPESALQADESVWTVDERDNLRELTFELVARRDQTILVRSEAITPATRVVTTPVEVPLAGMPVRTAPGRERMVSR